MTYSACELNKQGDNIQSWHTPFPIWNQSVVSCPVLTVVSWPAYRFLKRQIRYGYESWTVKKAEHWRIDAFELRCWRRLLRVPWTARRSNQSTLKEISPGCSSEELMLKLKLQYFGPLMWRVDSLEKTLMLGGMGAGGEGDDREWDGWMASPTQWTCVRVNSGSWWWTGRPGMLRFMGSQRVRHDWVTQLNWTYSNKSQSCFLHGLQAISRGVHCSITIKVYPQECYLKILIFI